MSSDLVEVFEEVFSEIPWLYKPHLEMWADELSQCEATMIMKLVRHRDMDRNQIGGCLCACVVAKHLIDYQLLRDEEDITIDDYMSCLTAYREFQAAWAALSLPSD